MEYSICVTVFKMRATALVLGLATLVSAVSYHGYKVVTVTPRTLTEVQLVEDTVQKLQLDLWTHGGEGKPIDILVPPSLQYVFLTGLRSKGIHSTIKIQNVQKIITEQATEQKSSHSTPRAFDHTQYHSLAEIYAIIDGVEGDYSSIVSSYVAGTTYEGRDIRVVKVSSDGSDTKPVIWLDCGIHAREWISPATCQYILDQLTSGYGTDSDVTTTLDTYDFHIMIVTNPDGYEFTWTDDRLWRKNRVPYGNCYGTDPNRNFDSHFGEAGASDLPCSSTYHGPSAFSEKESQAVRDAIAVLGDRFKMYYNIHSYSQLWMFPYGYSSTQVANYAEQNRVAGVGVSALTAVHGTAYEYGDIYNTIYQVSGGSVDWAYDATSVEYSYTIELRDTGNFGFLLPAAQILPTGEETYAGIMAAVNAM